MKSRYLIAFVLGFASSSHGALLDDWSNDDLCGWMESSATPEYIQTEVQKREIICYAGVEVSSLPSSQDNTSQYGTVFPSPDPSLISVMTNDKDKSNSY
ncbi:transposase [Candidatus Pseudothioglobus singularis]|nr:transposase [Candidatus Pseudothioglobus singularis]